MTAADNPAPMHTLRRFTFLIRLLLAWFVLSLGVAAASPFIQSQDILWVCADSGSMKLLFKAADGSTSEENRHSMDCPLCGSPLAPPPLAHTSVKPAQPLAYALQTLAAAHIAARIAAPLPARGPPMV